MPPFADPLPSNVVLPAPEIVAAPPLPSEAGAAADVAPLVPGRFGWTARDFDAATGLHYNVARYYSETPGSWTSEDPIGLCADDLNRYRYPGDAPDAERPS